MTSMSRRAFGARALGTAAVASAAAAGLAPAAGAQTGSLGSAGTATTPTAAPTGDAGVDSLTPEQLAELDTTVAVPPTPSFRSLRAATNPFPVTGGSGVHVQASRQVDERTWLVDVYSPANQRTMRVAVQGPAPSAGPRPTLYCLDGYSDWAPAGDDSIYSGWFWAGGGHDFFADKNVTVVYTCDDGPTMYRDFLTPVPGRGAVRWETFLTKELPPLIDAAMNGNGRNGLLGISSGACAAFMTAVRNRSLYTTIAGLSGVYDVDNTFGKALWSRMWKDKQIDPAWVMGGWFNSQWGSNDPYAVVNGNTQSLRGKTLYLSAAAGLPSGEQWSRVVEDPRPVVYGGSFEATAFNATLRFAGWLGLSGCQVTQDYRARGIHDWPLWRQQLPFAWPTIAKGLGVDGQTPAPVAQTLR